MKNTPFNFTCKYCAQPVTITEEDYVFENINVYNKPNFKTLGFDLEIIYCPNPICRKIHINQHIEKTSFTPPSGGGAIYFPGRTTKESQIINVIPVSGMIFLPDFLPKDIKRDIEEANLIKNFSQRASASLLRRALQSMIRDFWKDKLIVSEISREIEQLKDLVSDTSLYNALHSLKNIAAFAGHPEKDITSIIEITKEELDQMFYVIIILVKEWYINKNERDKSLKLLNKTATQKIQKSKK